MRKEEVQQFQIPFKIISKKGSIATVRDLIRLNEETLTFRDKFGGTQIIALSEIATIQSMGDNHAI